MSIVDLIDPELALHLMDNIHKFIGVHDHKMIRMCKLVWRCAWQMERLRICCNAVLMDSVGLIDESKE